MNLIDTPVRAECYLLFNVGEIIGKGAIIGYPVGPNGYVENDH